MSQIIRWIMVTYCFGHDAELIWKSVPLAMACSIIIFSTCSSVSVPFLSHDYKTNARSTGIQYVLYGIGYTVNISFKTLIMLRMPKGE